MDGQNLSRAEIMKYHEGPRAPHDGKLESEILAGPAMVAFVIPMLSPVGIIHGSTVSMQREETAPWLEDIEFRVSDQGPELPFRDSHMRVSLKFWRPKRNNLLLKQLAEEMMKVTSSITGEPHDGSAIFFEDENAAGTVIEASTPLFDANGEGYQKALSDAFDRSIEELSRFLRVLRVHLNDPTIPLVGRDSIPGGVIYIVRYGGDDLDILTKTHQGLFMVNFGHAIPSDVREDIDAQTFKQVLIRYSNWIRGNPLFSAEDNFQRGMRARWMEADSQGAVVALYTAIEIFCNGLLGLCQWESGGTREDLMNWLENEGFSKRLRHRFHGFLGGNWDPDSSSSPIRSLNDVATVRHRIVHAGYEPTLEEVDRATDAYGTLCDFAKARLVASRYCLPRTTMVLLGKPGLKRKNAWTKRFEKLAEQLMEEDDWLASYAAWRQP